MSLAESLDRMPPSDLEAEQKLLSAFLVMETSDRNRWTLRAKAEDFHDPFHRWLFVCLRKARQDFSCRELLEFVLRQPCEFSRRGYSLARLLVSESGAPIAGSVTMVRSYAARLAKLRERRERIVELETELLRLIND